MTVSEQAKNYLKAIPPAISHQDGHIQCLAAARALVYGFNLPTSEAMSLLQEWNQTCLPPWSQKELDHKIHEADIVQFDKPRGYLLSGRHSDSTAVRKWTPAPPVVAPEEKPKYDLSVASPTDIPHPINEGFPILLKHCYLEGEGVRIMNGFSEDGTTGCDPNGGLVLTREEWLTKLAGENNDINNFFLSASKTHMPGLYLGMNPMKVDGRGRDSDVTSLRFCLLEFDTISLEEQWLLLKQSNVPCAVVIYSGNKSLHAWVKIDARTRKEFDDRVNLVYNHFAAYKPDTKNRNPARLSRCPDAARGAVFQSLLAIDLGAPTFTDWSKDILVEGIGTTHSFKEIRAYVPEADGKTVAGKLWLRKGGACLLIGPSGVGKSTLGRQIAIYWALGRPAFGLVPVKALKILMIQAENDLADMHEMDFGICQGMGIENDQEALEMVHNNLITNHNVSDTGNDFIVAMRKLIDRHEPDLIVADPLLSFIGTDISKQENVSLFCRNWLNPVLSTSNVAMLAIHHTGKPAKEQKTTRGMVNPVRTMAEWAYQGLGSSELTNWARGIMVINQVEDGFELLMAKRGKRAAATHPNGEPTETILLRHNPEFIFWEQRDPEILPVSVSEPKEIHVNLPNYELIATANLSEFLSQIPEGGEDFRDIKKRLAIYASNVLHINPSAITIRMAVDALVANSKLQLNSDLLYIKGPNA